MPKRASGLDQKEESHLAGTAEMVETMAQAGVGSLVGPRLPRRGENLLLRPPRASIIKVTIAKASEVLARGTAKAWSMVAPMVRNTTQVAL